MSRYGREYGLVALPPLDTLAGWVAERHAAKYPILQNGPLNAVALFSVVTLAACQGLMALVRFAGISYPAHLPLSIAFWTMVVTLMATLVFPWRPLYRAQCFLVRIRARHLLKDGARAAREALAYLHEAINTRYIELEDQTRQDIGECRALISRVHAARGKIPNAPPHCKTDEFDTLRMTSSRELAYIEHCLGNCKNHAALLSLHRDGIRETVDSLNARLDIVGALCELPLRPSNVESIQENIWSEIEKLATLVNDSLVDAERQPLAVVLTDWEERLMVAEDAAPLLVSSSFSNDERGS